MSVVPVSGAGVSGVPLIVWPSSGNDHAGVSVDPDSMGVLSSGSKCGSMGVPSSGRERGSVGVVPVSAPA